MSEIIIVIATIVIAITTVIYAVAAIFQWKENKNLVKIAIITFFSEMLRYMEESVVSKKPHELIKRTLLAQAAFIKKYFEKESVELVGELHKTWERIERISKKKHKKHN